ncbi:MAG TPA: hypothetical protein VN035_10165, partial [Microbacterium sp.]|nr:hypothetical protein [Microbacterium sp.]
MSVTGVQKKRTGPRSTVAVISVLTMLVAMLGIVSPAQAAVDDGTLTVSVARTFTETGVADPASDVPQEGMQVTVTDAAGASVS